MSTPDKPAAWAVKHVDSSLPWFVSTSKSTCDGHVLQYGHRRGDGYDHEVVPLYLHPPLSVPRRLKVPHPHKDIIFAWALGEEIQYRINPGKGEWETLKSDAIISWDPKVEYRVKPDKELRKGWIIVLASATNSRSISGPYATKEGAESVSTGLKNVIEITQIEWSE